MAVPDPPFLTPRIFKVLEPSAGHYEVVVKMDPSLASKFPEKPFGTAISAIGLAVKDSDKYPGYTLVSIEPADKGGKDHLWVFQKLDGPEWTTKSVGQDGSVPPRYKRMIATTRTKQDVASGTELDALSGNLVASIVEQQDNTGKAVKVNTEEVLTLDTSSVDESVERKPFVSIKSTMTPGPAPVIPGTGNGSARLVYENGPTKIYENVAEVATAIPGLKGIETNAQQWGALVTTTNYTTSSSAPAGGSLQLIYNDGNVWVYESSTSTPSVAGSSTDVDSKEWGKITWNGNFSTSPSGDRSKQVWSNGSTQVFLNENASLSVSGSSKDVEPREWGYITWNGTYSSASGGTKSRQVYSGPGGSVFLNETPVPSVSGTSVDIDPKEWGSVRWDGSYQSTPSTTAGARSKQVWSMGGTSVYHVETPTVTPNSGSFVSAREQNTVLTEVQTTSYDLAANSGANTRSRVVFSIGTTRVYENISIERTTAGMRTYASVVQVDLPPVFRGYRTQTVTRNDGQDSFIFTPNVAAGYRGTMACTVEETWSEDPGSGQVPTIFRPAPMSFQSPLGGFSVGECLHGQVTVTVGVGTEHPVYSSNSYDMSYDATQPADWVGLNIIAHVDTVPYNQGFLTRVYKVQL